MDATLEAALYVVETVEKNKEYANFFKYSWGCDEFVFQTILMNSHFKNNVVSNHYRYIDWSAGGQHPKLLDANDFEKMVNSDNLFARKFKTSHDSKILDLLDGYIQ